MSYDLRARSLGAGHFWGDRFGLSKTDRMSLGRQIGKVRASTYFDDYRVIRPYVRTTVEERCYRQLSDWQCWA